MIYDTHIFIIVGIAILLDIATGFTQALYNKSVSSEKMRSGVYHKLSYLFAVAIAYYIEHAMSYLDLGYTMPLVIPACTYIVVTELVSIIENLKQLNPELKDSGIFKLLSSKKDRDNE